MHEIKTPCPTRVSDGKSRKRYSLTQVNAGAKRRGLPLGFGLEG